jgi:hypothetical protein
MAKHAESTITEPDFAGSRGDLVVEIQELEGCLYYMGSGHPQRDATRVRLESLKALLSRWDGPIQAPSIVRQGRR